MKIIHTVESYSPSLGGMQEVVKQLSERLAAKGHDVTVATSFHPDRKFKVLNGVKIEQFKISGNEVRGMVGDTEQYQQFLINSNADIIANFAAQQWATDLALDLLPQLKAKKVFIPTGFSGLYLPEYKNYFEKMKKRMHHYDCNVFLSDDYRDINFARANGIHKNILIPNGASSDEFTSASYPDIRKKLGIDPSAFLLLHVGSFSRIKGHLEAAEIFLRSKLKNAVLLFIGNNNEQFSREKSFIYKVRTLLSGKKIIITHDFTRPETVAAYKAADLFLFPSNVECSPIVLFECMASETPFLTTDVGNSKEIISWSGGGMVLPTTFDKEGNSHAVINDSVKMLNELYENSSGRKSLADKGNKAWKEKFTWEHIAGEYEGLYTKLLTS